MTLADQCTAGHEAACETWWLVYGGSTGLGLGILMIAIALFSEIPHVRRAAHRSYIALRDKLRRTRN